VDKSLKISHSALNKHFLNTNQQSTSVPGQKSSGLRSGTLLTHQKLSWICKWRNIRGPMLNIRGAMRNCSST